MKTTLLATTVCAALLGLAPAAAHATKLSFGARDVPTREIRKSGPSGITTQDTAPVVRIDFGQGESPYYDLDVRDANDRSVIDRVHCANDPISRVVRATGPGEYRIIFNYHDYDQENDSCGDENPAKEIATFRIAAPPNLPSVTPPAGTLLTRKAGSTTPLVHRFAIGGLPNVPKAVTIARVGATTPTFSGAVVTPTLDVRFTRPGTYAAGATGGPPSAFRVFAPFDLRRVSLLDKRGPSYRLAGYVRAGGASGRVKISIARGRKGGTYRRLGTVRIRKGRVTKRFTARRTGFYRLQFSFGGSKTIAKGRFVSGFNVQRPR